MILTIDTENLTERDRQILGMLNGGFVGAAAREGNAETEKPGPAPETETPKAAPKTRKAKAADPAPESDDAYAPAADEPASAPTMADAVAAATAFCAKKDTDKGGIEFVRAALAAAGASRVSELTDEGIVVFLDTLNA